MINVERVDQTAIAMSSNFRFRRFLHGVASSYAVLVFNILYVLGSVPLALHFLQKQEFGLWALLMPVVGYMTLIDFGMTSAISRLLIDHKDKRESGIYGALIKTAFLVGFVQGAIIFGVIALFAPAVAALLGIPTEYVPTFVTLLRLQVAVSAFAFTIRPLNLILTAHQRMDLCSYGEAFSLLSSLVWLWMFLRQGVGVFSFVYATAISTVIVPIYLGYACRSLQLFPRPGESGRVTAKLFREVFAYGKDIFLVAAGTQMVLASQALIVSRRLGLDAVAAWAVGTKMFNLIAQLVWRMIGVSLPALSEMITRGEHERLRTRFKDFVAVIASFSVFLGISFALCNSPFVHIWTAGKISWSPLNDILLAAWLVLLSLQSVHNNLVIATKQIRMLRYVFFLEGLSFIALAILVGAQMGMPGIIFASIICTAAYSFAYGIWRSSRYFESSFPLVAIQWIRPGIIVLLIFGAVAVLVWKLTGGLSSFQRFTIHALCSALVGGFLFLRFGIPSPMHLEISARLPRAASRFWKYVSPAETTSPT